MRFEANSSGVRRAAGLPWLLAVGLAFLFSASMAFAQGGNLVSGTIRDATGAVIPGASVVLRNDASGTQLRTTSNRDGFYTITPVPVATYTLTVSAKGFKQYAQTGIVIHPGESVAADATLQVGAQIQTVEVKSSAVNLIPKTEGGTTRTITATQIQNLSTEGRDAMELLYLLPGVVGATGIPGGPGADFTKGSGFQVGGVGISAFNVNGLRSDQNMIKLDGADIIDPGDNGGFAVEPNMDMIQEFSVKTSGFQASQGQGGIIVNAVTKSGGAKIHGEGYWYVRNAVLNANDWSNNFAGISKPNSKFNYPGGNVGGPVRLPFTDFNHNNDKMFFFYGIELQRQLADPGTQLKVLPTAAMRDGNFSELWTAKHSTCTKDANGVVTGGNFLNMPCIVHDIATGQAAVGNILSAPGVTAAGQALLNTTYQMPVPGNIDAVEQGSRGGDNFASRPLYPTNRIENVVRIDYNLTQNTRAYVRLDKNSDTEYYPYGLWWGSGVPRITPDTGNLSGETATLNVVKVINPTLTNEVQFSATAERFPWKMQDLAKATSPVVSQAVKGWNWLAGESGKSYFGRSANVPTVWDGVDSTGSDNWNGSNNTGDPSGVYGRKTTFELTDNLTKVKGTHTLQFGADLLHTRNDQNGADTMGRIWSTNWGDGGNTGNIFGNLLAQGVTQYDQSTNSIDGMWRFWNYEFYAQDSWKVTRRLTLNYGARFAYLPPWYEARGKVATFNPLKWNPNDPTDIFNGVQVGSGIQEAYAAPYFPTAFEGKYVPGLPSSGGFPNPPITIEPRVGFAYDVFGNGNTVLRAGGGLFYERDQGNTVFGAAQNIPFQIDIGGNIDTNAVTGPGWAKISQPNPFGGVGAINYTVYDQTDRHGAESYEYNFTLDQNLGHQTVLEVGYNGNVGRHLYIENNINPVQPGAMWMPGTQLNAPGAIGNSNLSAYRHYKPYNGLNILHHVSTSNYNSLQATVRRNVSHGLTLLASYTYSKTLGYSGAFNGTVDPFNTRNNYGLMSYDRPQVLSFSYIYQLPSLGRKYFNGNRYAGGVLDGWQLSGVASYQSGSPLGLGIAMTNPTNNSGCISPDATSLCSNGQYWNNGNLGEVWYGTPDHVYAGNNNNLAPQLLFNPQYGANFSGVDSGAWLNGYSVSAPGFNKLGTTETPQFLGPATNNWDMTLFKSFNLGEDRRLEFRWAAFDIFNRAQLDNPNTGAQLNWVLPSGATSFAQGHATGILNSSPTCSSGYQFGCILNKHGHREMELAIKLFF